MIGSTHAVSGKFEIEALSVVCVQFPLVRCLTKEDVNLNVDQIIEWMERAVNSFPGVDLFVCSECSMQGGGPFCTQALIELDGPEVKRLTDKCKELQIYGVFNPLLIEYEGNPGVSMAIIVNDKGEIIHKYTKMNPWTPAEPFYPGWLGCTAVDGPKGSRLATIICADGDIPESWREAAVNGANVIIRISHYPTPWDNAWEITNKAGAYCNQVYVVTSNTVGTDDTGVYFGHSMIIDPDGTIITEAPKGVPWMIKADIYPALVDQMRKEAVTNNLLWVYRHRGASNPMAAGVGHDIHTSLPKSE